MKQAKPASKSHPSSSFWNRVPMVLITSVVVSVAFIILLVLVPVESRGEAVEPVTFLIAAVALIGMSGYSWYQQRAALQGTRLKWLLEEGLTIEQLGGYVGIKGNYRGYFMRVCVDPASHFPKQYWPTLFVLVYFQPMRTREGKRDIALLRRIENELLNEVNWRYAENLTCHAIHMRSYTVLAPWVSRNKVKKRIDKIIDRIAHHGLKPWPEEAVAKWVLGSPELHGPQMQPFQDHLRKRTDV